MSLGPMFQAFVDKSPVSVMVRATLERVLHADALQALFEEHALLQITRKITFSRCVQIMDAVVFKIQPSPGAWYSVHGHELSATRQAMYDKLKNIEPQVSAALVHHAGKELMCVQHLRNAPPAPLPGYRLRILDGNHLTGTEHRLKGLRGTRAAALPGQALVFYDPRYDLITDVIPCPDAYTQERALLGQALELIADDDCILGDRNFCTSKFLFGIKEKTASFVIRQHAANLNWQALCEPRVAGMDESGRELQEQSILLTDPNTGQTMQARRITIPLRQPKDKEQALHVLTNLPPEKADAYLVAELYAKRWTIEHAFQQLTDDLRTEINTLAYPQAALFGFCLACVAYNGVSLVKAALRSTLGAEFVAEKLSTYYLTLEVARVTCGMEIAIAEKEWEIFRHMSQEEFLATIMDLADRVEAKRYTKHKRGPKKPPPKKKSGKRVKHVSTARVLAETD
jgi:IS4 transposase